MAKNTSISLTYETKERLEELGSKGDSYDSIVSDLLDRAAGTALTQPRTIPI